MKLTLITSTYRSERWLPYYSQQLAEVSAQLAARGVIIQVALIANDATATERQQIARLADLLGDNAALDVCFVPQETVYASWNRALGLAVGDAIGFWNVDDEHYASGYLHALDAIAQGYTLVDLSYRVIQRYRRWGVWPAVIAYDRPARYTQQGHGRKHGYGPFAIIARALFDQVGNFDERFRIAGDLDWSVRSVPYARALRSEHVGGVFHLHGRNLSDSGNPLQIVENNIIFLRQRQWTELQPADPQLMREALAHWGADISDVPRPIRDWLLGKDAWSRARRYQQMSRWPLLRRARAALLHRRLLKSDPFIAPTVGDAS